MDDFLAAQVVMRYASAAARDADASLTASLREGMVCYLVDTDVLAYHNGTAWTEWHRGTATQSASPLLNQSANVTYTKTRANYRKYGRDVFYDFDLTCTSAGSSGTDIALELPFPAAASQVGGILGNAFIYDLSTTLYWFSLVMCTSTTYMKFAWLENGVAFCYVGGTGSATIALASGDVVRGSVRYESAA